MGFLIIFDHNRLGMCFVDFSVWARHFSVETKGRTCGTENRKRKKKKKKEEREREGERESHPEIGGAFWQTVGIHFTPR